MKCLQVKNKEDCANMEGLEHVCKALHDTYFGDRQCPFYKPKDQAEKERKAIDKKLGRA